MSRVLGLASVLAVGALLVGMLLPRAGAPGWIAASLVIVAGIVLAAVVVVVFAMAWRTKGWSFRNLGEPDDAASRRDRRQR